MVLGVAIFLTDQPPLHKTLAINGEAVTALEDKMNFMLRSYKHQGVLVLAVQKALLRLNQARHK